MDPPVETGASGRTVERRCAGCGFTRSYASEAQADSYHRRHSCAKHLRDQARRPTAGKAEHRAVRDCTHPQARHEHGTRAAYVRDRCRCAPCTEANRLASAQAARDAAYGRAGAYTNPSRARAHVQRLRAAGIGLRQIGALSGISNGALTALLYGLAGRPLRRIHVDTEARLLAIQADPGNRASQARVDARGTHRRLHALVADGWALSVLATELGRDLRALTKILARPQVTARTASDVAALYDRLEQAAPPQTTAAQRRAMRAARQLAAERGWLASSAWDDIDHDDLPPERGLDIDEVAVERAMSGQRVALNAAEQAEAARRLTAQGVSLREIATRLRTSIRTVSRRRAATAA